jgi:hypothetical protein
MGVWAADAAWYRKRRDGHTELWRYVASVCLDNGITSMLEIGG